MRTAETLVPVDPVDPICVELVARAEAHAATVGATAAGRIPSPRPDTPFWRVRTVGGTQASLTHTAWTVVIESYAEFDSTAAEFANFAHGFIQAAGRDGWVGGIPCSGVEVFAVPQILPDPLTEQPRYSATYAVSLRDVVA